MPSATILFIDMAGFSQKPTEEQRRLVNLLTREIQYRLQEELHPPEGTPGVLALPTGDGMALAFVHRGPTGSINDRAFALCAELHQWAHQQAPSVALRAGLHTGAVELVTDINGKTNVCGDTINYTQRIMDAASPRQTLVSDALARAYVGLSTDWRTFVGALDLKFRLDGPFDVFAKHGLHLPVRQLVFQPVVPWVCQDEPAAKHLEAVKLSPLSKPIEGAFADLLGNASRIALVQVTGRRLFNALKSNSVKLRSDLERFWIFMPSADRGIYPSNQVGTVSLEEIKEWVENWRILLGEFRRTVIPQADVALHLLNVPLYSGASFIDWEWEDGRIHVSPSIWTFATDRTPGFELEWKGRRPAPFYEYFSEGLDRLRTQLSTRVEVD